MQCGTNDQARCLMLVVGSLGLGGGVALAVGSTELTYTLEARAGGFDDRSRSSINTPVPRSKHLLRSDINIQQQEQHACVGHEFGIDRDGSSTLCAYRIRGPVVRSSLPRFNPLLSVKVRHIFLSASAVSAGRLRPLRPRTAASALHPRHPRCVRGIRWVRGLPCVRCVSAPPRRAPARTRLVRM